MLNFLSRFSKTTYVVKNSKNGELLTLRQKKKNKFESTKIKYKTRRKILIFKDKKKERHFTTLS